MKNLSYSELVDFLVEKQGYRRDAILKQPYSTLVSLVCDAPLGSKPDACNK